MGISETAVELIKTMSTRLTGCIPIVGDSPAHDWLVGRPSIYLPIKNHPQLRSWFMMVNNDYLLRGRSLSFRTIIHETYHHDNLSLPLIYQHEITWSEMPVLTYRFTFKRKYTNSLSFLKKSSCKSYMFIIGTIIPRKVNQNKSFTSPVTKITAINSWLVGWITTTWSNDAEPTVTAIPHPPHARAPHGEVVPALQSSVGPADGHDLGNGGCHGGSHGKAGLKSRWHQWWGPGNGAVPWVSRMGCKGGT